MQHPSRGVYDKEYKKIICQDDIDLKNHTSTHAYGFTSYIILWGLYQRSKHVVAVLLTPHNLYFYTFYTF